ncbi:uncharacterized protein LOC122052484 [Zingiber officinale]|uniref:uncharacterized protein LOC122052484 n=1 Tax=Zingiber officinale TaxID=94328 RepID=UPI001C4CC4EF|nr:uncharacterized protein LOC122052484 [Zingiber officinale]
MEEALLSDSVKKRLRMQNEVLKLVADFSEKLNQRAKDITIDINSLLDQAGAVELDLKNTANNLWNLSRNLLIDHKIADQDGISHTTKDHAEGSAQGIPAQDYEKDILPRYKTALSMGLTSCKKFLNNKERGHKTNSIFRTGSSCGPLPHVIGSEEYIHDNGCGITENSSSRNLNLDFSLIMESQQASSVDSPDLFDHDMFVVQSGSSEKDSADPLASAAADFKAMLEAALLNPYKFYDEESSSVDIRSTMNSVQMHNNTVGLQGEQETVTHGILDDLSSALEEDKPTLVRDLLPHTHSHEFYSSLVGGSLFDVEDDVPSGDGTDISANIAESNSLHSAMLETDGLAEATHSLDITEAYSDQNLIASAGDSHNDEQGSEERNSLEEAKFEMDNSKENPTTCPPEY